MTVVLDRLQRAGAIRREPNPEDGRSSVVYVEPKFLRSAQTAYQRMGKATDALLAQFSNEELGLIVGFLRKANEMQI